jgi:hypothetical protein
MRAIGFPGIDYGAEMSRLLSDRNVFKTER